MRASGISDALRDNHAIPPPAAGSVPPLGVDRRVGEPLDARTASRIVIRHRDRHDSVVEWGEGGDDSRHESERVTPSRSRAHAGARRRIAPTSTGRGGKSTPTTGGGPSRRLQWRRRWTKRDEASDGAMHGTRIDFVARVVLARAVEQGEDIPRRGGQRQDMVRWIESGSRLAGPALSRG